MVSNKKMQIFAKSIINQIKTKRQREVVRDYFSIASINVWFHKDGECELIAVYQHQSIKKCLEVIKEIKDKIASI